MIKKLQASISYIVMLLAIYILPVTFNSTESFTKLAIQASLLIVIITLLSFRYGLKNRNYVFSYLLFIIYIPRGYFVFDSILISCILGMFMTALSLSIIFIAKIINKIKHNKQSIVSFVSFSIGGLFVLYLGAFMDLALTAIIIACYVLMMGWMINTYYYGFNYIHYLSFTSLLIPTVLSRPTYIQSYTVLLYSTICITVGAIVGLIYRKLK